MTRIRNIWARRALVVVLGAAAGLAYYHWIGCTSGRCPITSNPFVSTVCGAVIGGLAGWSQPHKDTK